MKPLIVTFLALVFCAGCAKPYLANGDSAQFARDNYECRRDSQMNAYPMGNGLQGPLLLAAAMSQSKKIYGMCMDSKGYRQASD